MPLHHRLVRSGHPGVCWVEHRHQSMAVGFQPHCESLPIHQALAPTPASQQADTASQQQRRGRWFGNRGDREGGFAVSKDA